MPHQDERNLATNRRAIEELIQALVAKGAAEFVRHGNADGAGADIPALRDQLARLSAEARG